MVISLLISCDVFEKLTEPDTSIKIICLVDFSYSVPAETTNWYKEIIGNKILSNLKVTDEIVVMPIDYGSLTSSVEIIASDLKMKDFEVRGVSSQQKEKYIERNRNKFIDTLKTSFSEQYDKIREDRKEKRLFTDILGSLSQSLKYKSEKDERILMVIIFSDMLNETTELDLKKNLNNSNDVNRLLEKSKKLDYRGSEIYVLTGDQTAISIEKFNLLKNFWTGYFNYNNAKLIEYDTGSITLLEKRIIDRDK